MVLKLEELLRKESNAMLDYNLVNPTYKQLNIQEKTNLAWLAGLIDGDGCFDLTNKKRPRSYRLRICLEERDKFVLEKVQDIAGGTLNRRNHIKSWKAHWKIQWQWSLMKHSDLLELCLKLEPYLVLKRDMCLKVINALGGY